MSAHRNKKLLKKLPVFPWKNLSKQHSFFNHFHCCTTSTPSKICFIIFHSSTTLCPKEIFLGRRRFWLHCEMKTYSFERSFWKQNQNTVIVREVFVRLIIFLSSQDVRDARCQRHWTNLEVQKYEIMQSFYSYCNASWERINWYALSLNDFHVPKRLAFLHFFGKPYLSILVFTSSCLLWFYYLCLIEMKIPNFFMKR